MPAVNLHGLLNAVPPNRCKHRLEPDGVHTGTGRGGDWNAEWRKFKADNPIPENMSEIQKEAIRRNVKKKRDEMRERYYEKK